MKNFIWLVVGVAAGFVVAHEVNKTQQGKQFFSDLDAKAREFGEAMSDGYRQREAELRAALGDVDASAAPSSVPFSAPSAAPSSWATTTADAGSVAADSVAADATAAESSVDIEADDAAFDAALDAVTDSAPDAAPSTDAK